jgi:hypothetical protein
MHIEIAAGEEGLLENTVAESLALIQEQHPLS